MKFLSSFFYNINAPCDIDNYCKIISLSSYISKKNFNDFNLYLDNNSFNYLNKFLHPSVLSSVILKPESKNNLDFFWAYNKLLYNYNIKSKFCSIDIDCFIWLKNKIVECNSDFMFYSIDKPNEDHNNPYYKIGFDALNHINCLPDSFKKYDSFPCNLKYLDFTIYNMGILLCNNFEIYEKYMNELNKTLENSQKINKFVNENKYVGSYSVSQSVTIFLEQILLSKVVHDNKCSIETVYKYFNKGFAFPSRVVDLSNIPITHLMGSKKNDYAKSMVDQLYNKIIKTNE
jgi:hypothetical protein